MGNKESGEQSTTDSNNEQIRGGNTEMNLKLTKKILPQGHRNRPGYVMHAKGLLFHTTNNWADGAGDELHAEYMLNQKDRTVSWHYTVDKDSATQHIPESENAWHAGDGGNGYYNRNFIGMEIACEAVKEGQPIDKATYNNAVELAADICFRYNFDYEHLQPHKIVYGKDCPHHTLLSHEKFKKDVMAKVKKLQDAAKPAKPSVTSPTAPDIETTYVVQKGDSLSAIAKRFNTTIAVLVRINKIPDPSIIHTGQKINIPAVLHVVKRGDTLTGIAERYGTDTNTLVRLNDLADPDAIYVGQRLKLLGKVDTTPVKKDPVKPAPKPELINGIAVKARIKIVGVTHAAYICDKPSVKSKNLATIGVGKTLPVSGSVPGWWEVVYEGKRAYVTAKFGEVVK